MNARQAAVLAREIAQFCASVCHLGQVLHNEKREATPDDLAPLNMHHARTAMALAGRDPNDAVWDVQRGQYDTPDAPDRKPLEDNGASISR